MRRKKGKKVEVGGRGGRKFIRVRKKRRKKEEGREAGRGGR
jgi:hypothetical protein